MNLSNYLDIAQEVKTALETGRPVVALESTVLSLGMPYPENLKFAMETEKILRSHRVVPATMAVIDGRMKVGLSAGEMELLCRSSRPRKISRRDLPIVLAEGGTGGTTSASAMIFSSLVGIRVFAAAGIGGVQQGAETTMDISADLQELARTPVAVVCAGAKMTLDVGLTLQYLETMGVPVLGYQTEEFPSFCCRSTGFGVDHTAVHAMDAARIARTKWDLGLQGGLLIACPIPKEAHLDFDEMRTVTDTALALAAQQGIRSRDLPGFLLRQADRLTEGRSTHSIQQLAYNNTRVAAEIASALASL